MTRFRGRSRRNFGALFDKLWVHFGIALGSFFDYFRVISGLILAGYFCIILGLLWVCFGITLGFFLDYFGVIFGLLWVHFWITLG